jgi:hypothetical protein
VDGVHQQQRLLAAAVLKVRHYHRAPSLSGNFTLPPLAPTAACRPVRSRRAAAEGSYVGSLPRPARCPALSHFALLFSTASPSNTLLLVTIRRSDKSPGLFTTGASRSCRRPEVRCCMSVLCGGLLAVHSVLDGLWGVWGGGGDGPALTIVRYTLTGLCQLPLQ